MSYDYIDDDECYIDPDIEPDDADRVDDDIIQYDEDIETYDDDFFSDQNMQARYRMIIEQEYKVFRSTERMRVRYKIMTKTGRPYKGSDFVIMPTDHDIFDIKQ